MEINDFTDYLHARDLLYDGNLSGQRKTDIQSAIVDYVNADENNMEYFIKDIMGNYPNLIVFLPKEKRIEIIKDMAEKNVYAVQNLLLYCDKETQAQALNELNIIQQSTVEEGAVEHRKMIGHRVVDGVLGDFNLISRYGERAELTELIESCKKTRLGDDFRPTPKLLKVAHNMGLGN
jgi:hypothetical protein